MADVFTNDLRIREQESGSNAGTWGGLLNTTIRNIASAFGQGSETIPNASTHTITLADGVADEARSMYLKCTGGGQACTVTLAPNTISKVWIISNETSFTLTFTQGSGANVAVAAGAVKMIVTDGAGSGAAVTDALSGLDASLSGLTVDTTTLVVDATNNRVGVGSATPLSLLDAEGAPLATSGALLRLRNSSATTSNTTYGGVFFSSSPGTDFSIGKSNVNAATSLSFRNGNTGASLMELTSAGNLLVGKTTSDGGVAGHELREGSFAIHTRNSGPALYVRRLGSGTNDNGTLQVFENADGQVGSIGTLNSVLTIGTGDTGIQFNQDVNALIPHNTTTGANVNNSIDLGYADGTTNLRFKNVYLTGGIDFNGSSGGINTANRAFMMSEYEIGTCTIGFNTSNGDASLSRQDNVTGFYQKTGDICTVQFYSGGITFSAAGSGSARITGLPFNNRGGTYNYGACSVTHNSATTTDIQNGYTAPNNNFIILTQRHTTSGAVFRTGGVRYFMFSITYLTQ